MRIKRKVMSLEELLLLPISDDMKADTTLLNINFIHKNELTSCITKKPVCIILKNLIAYFPAAAILCFIILIAGCGENEKSSDIVASGNIEATDVTISSKIGGQIDEILVKEGDKIKTGDILLKLDHASLDIQLRQAEAAAEQAEAQLRLLLAGPRKEDVELAEEQVNLAEINLEKAENDKERSTNLYEQNAITLQMHEDALTRYEQILNQYNTAVANLDKVKNIVRKEDIESAKANLKRTYTGIDLIRKNIEDCTILSPVDGIVSNKFVEKGEFVTPGASVFLISDLQTVKIKIYVTEVELGRVKLGQDAVIKIDSYKDKTYSGKVIFVSTEAEFTPKNIQTKEERTKLVYAVKIEIPNPDLELKSGMPADATLKMN